MMKFAHWFLGVVLFVSACTGMKEVTSDDPLYIGNDFDYSYNDQRAAQVVDKINSDFRPEPNGKFLWMRPALARNHMLSDSAKVKKFWRKKVADPVTISMADGARMAEVISNRLLHSGYFSNRVSYDTVRHGERRMSFEFNVDLEEPHRLATIVFPDPVDTLTEVISESKEQSLLVTGDIYSLETLKAERTRIDRHLRNHGYIYFNPDFIGFRADSVSEDHLINLEIYVRSETPPESRTQYFVSKLYIFDEYVQDEKDLDTLDYAPYYLISNEPSIEFSALKQGLFIKPGALYSRLTRRQTTRYMNNLPIIQSATTNFVKVPGTDSLHALLTLSKRKRFAYSAELNTVFRSTNYFGPGVIFSLTDRNRMKRANQLQLNLRGRFEVQISDGVVNPAYEAGIEVNYQLPRLVPKFLRNIGSTYVPQTKISTGYNLFNRLDLYRLNSLFFDFSWLWKKNTSLSHKINPLDIIFTVIPESSKSDKFLEYLEDNPGVQRSFDEQFVVGMGYEINFDPPSDGLGDFRIRAGIDFAGNLLAGAYSVFGASKDSLGRYELLGIPFSQYVRSRIDLSYALPLNKKSSLVARFVTGIGVPFGNSEILPYISQFYVGGTNSLRSFVARSVGPGAVVPPEGFNDLTGDILFETNLEYRFTLAGKLKGALFVDAGNIWLFNEDATRPEGNFKFATFINEIAMSGGLGLRWDFDFVVARVDLAYTLRTPYLEEGQRWTKQLRIWDPTFNIAIGYPF